MKKKIVVFLLALVMVFSIIACTNNNKKNPNNGTEGGDSGTGTGTPADSYDASNILSTLPEKDFDGKDFRIYCANNYDVTIFVRQAPTVDADPADRLNSALYARDERIMEKYGVNIVYEIATDDTRLATTVRELSATATDAYDLVLISLYHGTTQLIPEGYALDLNESSLDLTNDWWNQNMTNAYTINGNTNFATGDITTRASTASSFILFNQQLFDDNQIAYPYEQVFNGTWTYDKFHAIYKDKAKDLDGDDTVSISTDMNGFHASSHYASYFGMGGRYTVLENDGSYSPYYNTTKSIDILQKLQQYLTENKDVTFYASFNGLDAFSNDRAWFVEVAACDLSVLRGMETDFGALPFPKYDETQEEYYNFANPWITTCVCFPITVPDLDYSGFITEALGALSKYTSSPEQYEILLLNKELRDDESKEVAELCAKTATYDLAHPYNFGDVRSKIEALIVKDGLNVTSQIASIDSAFTEELNNFIASLNAEQ